MAKILVGEDDSFLRQLYKLFLPMGYHDVITASNQKEIEQELEMFKPDLIILDIMLSGSDGRGICQKIKTANKDMKDKF